MTKAELLISLQSNGFADRIINAFQQVRREDFVPEKLKKFAYNNEPLPVGGGATISQPYTIAFMLDLLELKNNLKILEIGSGCGYVLALMNELSRNSQIYGVEIIKDLVDKSQQILSDYKNIKVIYGNGFSGLAGYQPYDRILISAAAEQMLEQLYSQLNNNGILVCPVQNSIWQIKKINGQIKTKEFPGFVFVPLIEN